MRIEELRAYRKELEEQLAVVEELKAAIVHVDRLIAFEERRNRATRTIPVRPPGVLNGSPRPTAVAGSRGDYPYRGTMVDKIIHAIKVQDRFVHRSEIDAYIGAHEKVNENTLSFNLSRLYRSGLVPRIQFNSASHLICYGLPRMVSRGLDGKLQLAKPEYGPKMDIPALEAAALESMEIQAEGRLAEAALK